MIVNFNDIYEDIHKASKQELDTLKSKNTKDTLMLMLILGIVVLTAFLINPIVGGIGILVSFIVFLTFYHRNNITYRTLYKIRVIDKLITGYSKSFSYTPVSDMSVYEYKEAEFHEFFDRYITEDEIEGTLSDNSKVKMAQVATFKEEIERKEDGTIERREVETFRGLYGFVRLNYPISNIIKVTTNSFLRKYDAKRIEVESTEFEKLFDIQANNKINAMQIFTPELLEKFVSLNFNKRNAFEVKVHNMTIYFRYRCGEIFEPPALSSGVDYDLLYKYFSIINYPIEIVENIIENAKLIR